MIVPASPRLIPHWNSATGELKFDGVLVKRFRTPAKSQFVVLDEFQQCGWEDSILDPLTGPVSKRSSHLHNTLVRLNGCQQGPARIVFERNDSGKVILWRILDTGKPPQPEISGESSG